jgi:hypothetical protein
MAVVQQIVARKMMESNDEDLNSEDDALKVLIVHNPDGFSPELIQIQRDFHSFLEETAQCVSKNRWKLEGLKQLLETKKITKVYMNERKSQIQDTIGKIVLPQKIENGHLFSRFQYWKFPRKTYFIAALADKNVALTNDMERAYKLERIYANRLVNSQYKQLIGLLFDEPTTEETFTSSLPAEGKFKSIS